VKLEDLVAIEEIQQLKARYFRLMDLKRWDEWGDVFTEDARLIYGPGPQDQVQGRERIVAHVSGVLAWAVTVHQGHMPEIRITGPDVAEGVWAMFDYTDSLYDYTDRGPSPGPDANDHDRFVKQGYGHYLETYRRDSDGRWRIAASQLTRLRQDRLSDG
jgi:hypothetical protein